MNNDERAFRFAKVTATPRDARGTIPTPEQLAQINRFTRRPFAAEELYIFQTDLANDQVDRSWERFPVDILRQFAATIVGRSHLIGHDYESAPQALFFDARVTRQDGANWLRGWSYMPKTAENEHARAMLDAGVYRYASIGYGPADGAMLEDWDLICDICGCSMFYDSPLGTCEHWPGHEYEIRGQRVIATFHYEGKWQAVEGSTVYLGCQYGAEHKAMGREVWDAADLERQTESLAIGQAVIFTKSVEGVACPRQRHSRFLHPFAAKPWEETENEIRCRVRDPEDFRADTFRSKTIHSGGKSIRLILGKLKEENVPDGHDPDSMVLQSLRFPKDEWTMAEAKAWYEEHKEELEKGLADAAKAAIPYRDEGIVEDGEAEWDADAEQAVGWEMGVEHYRRMHAWVDSGNEENKTAYKLPHHKADGLKAVWRGVVAAGAVLQGGRGGVDIPEADVAAVKAHIASHYRQWGETAPWLEEGQDAAGGGQAQFPGHSDPELLETCAKVGRVLSAANEEKLRKAHELVGEVLSSVEAQSEGEQDETDVGGGKTGEDAAAALLPPAEDQSAPKAGPLTIRDLTRPIRDGYFAGIAANLADTAEASHSGGGEAADG